MSHTGVWPAYQHIRERRLAALDPDGTLYDGAGVILGRHLDYEAVKATALAERLDVYVAALRHEHWADLLLDAIDDPHARVLCSLSGGIVGVQFRGARRQTASVAQAVNWDPQGGEDLSAILRAVEAVSRLLGAGTYISPGALGEAHWRLARADFPPVSVPCVAARRDLLAHLIGGRADTPALGESFAVAYESDMRSAYPALSIGVPCGTAGRMLHELDPDECATYYAFCRVVVPAGGTGLSPIPLPAAVVSGAIRDHLHSGGIRHVFRMVGGCYALWLWREEVEAARDAGFDVSIYHGWYWTRMETHNRSWLARLALARRTADDHAVLQLVKRAGVAAIGRHGMQESSYELVSEEAADKLHDTPIAGELGGNPIMGLWLHEVADGPPAKRLPHWYSFILMRCRLTLWRRMEAEKRRGNRPLLSNFDSVITAGPPTEPTSETDEPGTWRRIDLHDLRIVAPRSYTSREKTILPGVKR